MTAVAASIHSQRGSPAEGHSINVNRLAIKKGNSRDTKVKVNSA